MGYSLWRTQFRLNVDEEWGKEQEQNLVAQCKDLAPRNKELYPLKCLYSLWTSCTENTQMLESRAL